MNSNKASSIASKTSRQSSLKSTKMSPKVVLPKRVVPSKIVSANTGSEGKSCSTGVIDNTNKNVRQKKATKSDLGLKATDRVDARGLPHVDYCKNCGDNPSQINTKTAKLKERPAKDLKRLPSSIQQYYKNDNFSVSAQTLPRKASLDTIKEVSELRSSETLFHIPEDTDTEEKIEDIKQFRRENYFECHSTKFRMKNKGSAISIPNHKCVYRFYLNSRLFPVPLCTDHNGVARCIECHLPMNHKSNYDKKINGTIQVKVSFGDQTQDSTILLPVKDQLIIPQKRKEDTDEEVLYFGVISLDKAGHSVFNPTLPNQSLALKYQKGFQAFEKKQDFVYHEVEKEDVIYV